MNFFDYRPFGNSLIPASLTVPHPLLPIVSLQWATVAQGRDLSSISSSVRGESTALLQQIGELDDDWDGYGGFAPSEATLGHAMTVVNRLVEDFPQLMNPEISPTSNGTILLTWETGPSEATLEIGDNRFSGYIRCFSSLVPMTGLCDSLGQAEMSTIAGCLVRGA